MPVALHLSSKLQQSKNSPAENKQLKKSKRNHHKIQIY